jgi:hypothetical protein
MRVLAILAMFALGCASAPISRRRRPPEFPPDKTVRAWPASLPDLAQDVDTLVRFGDEMCDCAAQPRVSCACHVVAEMQRWSDEAEAVDLDELTAEQDERARDAVDRIRECGDEVLGSGRWCPGS